METFLFETRKIFVSVPEAEQPAAGFPVLYVLDGNGFTLLFSECIRLESRNSSKTGVWPGIVVGIGYDGDGTFFTQERFRDFTPKKKHLDIVDEKRKHLPEGGGLEDFVPFLSRLKAKIAADYPVDAKRQAIFGHSLGGLCVLELYVHKNIDFEHYLACSPSLWWDDYELPRRLRNFDDNKNEALNIFVGEGEPDMAEPIGRFTVALNKKTNIRRKAALYIAPDENHMSVVPTILSRALRSLEWK